LVCLSIMRRRMSAVIKNRTVCVLLHGRSIEQLGNHIESLQPYDLCYAGINQFFITEQYILSKINKKLDIVQDCSEVAFPQEFEPTIRVPRINEFLRRGDNNCILTTEKVFNIWSQHGLGWARDNLDYFNKCVFVENYVLRSVPNSLAIYLLYLARFGAKKIILFGCDGYIGPAGKDLSTYYHSDEVALEREQGFHNKEASGLHSDTSSFDVQFLELYRWYRLMHGIPSIEIVNCSLSSAFTIFRKIGYEQLLEELV